MRILQEALSWLSIYASINRLSFLGLLGFHLPRGNHVFFFIFNERHVQLHVCRAQALCQGKNRLSTDVGGWKAELERGWGERKVASRR